MAQRAIVRGLCAMVVKSKKAWWSKSNLFGVLQIATSVVAVFAGSELIQQYPKAVASIGIVSGGITILLRFLTSVPVEW